MVFLRAPLIPCRATPCCSRVWLLETVFGYTDPDGLARSTPVRVTSNNQRTNTHRGWYIDLLSPSGYQGEMQVTNRCCAMAG